jgi:hypothetical protein
MRTTTGKVVTLPGTGHQLEQGSIVIARPHPNNARDTTRVHTVDVSDPVFVKIGGDVFGDPRVAPDFQTPTYLEQTWVVPQPISRPPFHLGNLEDEERDVAFIAYRRNSLPNFDAGGSNFNVLGASGQIRDSWALAAFDGPAGAAKTAEPANVLEGVLFLSQAGYQLLPPDNYRRAEQQLQGVQKLAMFRRLGQPSLVAVQTKRGSWLTVLDSRFVEVQSLRQLEGGANGELAEIFAKPRHDEVQPGIDPEVGDLLTSETGHERFYATEQPC